MVRQPAVPRLFAAGGWGFDKNGVRVLGSFGKGLALFAGGWFRCAAVQRIRYQANPENRLLALIQKLHLPLRIPPELAADSANHLGAGTGQLLPGSIVVGQFDALLRRAGITAISNPKEIERHILTYRGPRGAGLKAPLGNGVI
jgi:hypothetical protein